MLVSQGIGIAARKLRGLFDNGSRIVRRVLERLALESLPCGMEVLLAKRSPDPGPQCEHMAHVDGEG